MNSLLHNFNELFQELNRETEPTRFQLKLNDYFYFIETNFLLKSTANAIFSKKAIQFKFVQGVYKAIVNNQPDVMFSVSPSSFEGLGFYDFHNKLIKELEKTGFVTKLKVLLYKENNNNRICLSESKPKCYVMRGKEPNRFKIIIQLYKRSSGLTAGEVAEKLYKDKTNKITQDGIKKEIREINRMFKKECETKEELVFCEKTGVKNLYFLNEKSFSFVLEK